MTYDASPVPPASAVRTAARARRRTRHEPADGRVHHERARIPLSLR